MDLLEHLILANKVQSEQDKKADRKTAISILSQSALLAAAITSVFFALPL